VVNADGSEQRRLTEKDAWDWRPVWSSDETRIVFHSNFGGNWDIHVMDADGRGTTGGATEQYPGLATRLVSLDKESVKRGMQSQLVAFCRLQASSGILATCQ